MRTHSSSCRRSVFRIRSGNPIPSLGWCLGVYFAASMLAGAASAPIVRLSFDESMGTRTTNTGTARGVFMLTTPIPTWSDVVPALVGGASAVDFGTNAGNFGVDSEAVMPELTGLSAFTLCGWANPLDPREGSGGNRLITWINNGGQGVDLVWRSDGSVQIGINQWPDSSPARSSPGRIPVLPFPDADNWRFFAVTYDSAAGQVTFYFGDPFTDAAFDVTRSYARGRVGTNIGRLTIGHFNTATRPNATNRMFRGLIDEIQIYGGVLSLSQIVSVQRTGTPGVIVPRIIRGPYLQMGTPTRLTVRWRTDIGTSSLVRYGLGSGSLTSIVVETAATLEHEVELTSLFPDTKYYYAVGSAETNLAGGAEYFFVTAPATSRPTRLWVLGDSGTASNTTARVRDAYYRHSADRYTDLWLMLGDNAYLSGTDAEYQRAVFEMYPEMLRQSVLWPAIGNHETYSDPTLTNFPYQHIFSLPANGEAGGVSSGTERYYSFDYGNIHLVCLDSMTVDRSGDAAMCQWLRADLAANHKDWLIAYWHHPPYSKGSHNSDAELELIQMRENALPILESYGVDLVLCGHSHSYERSFLLSGHYGSSSTLTPDMVLDSGPGRADQSGPYRKTMLGATPNQGTVYIVAGSSGWTSGGALNHPAMFVSLNQLGSLVIDVDRRNLEVKFLRETGDIDDYFSINKDEPEPLRLVHYTMANGSILLLWNAAPGRTYIVERAIDLSERNWTPVSDPIPYSGAIGHWSESIEGDGPGAYYRIRSDKP